MRPRYLLTTILSVTVFAVMLVLRLAGYLPRSAVAPTDSPPGQVVPVGRVEVQATTGTLTSVTTEPVVTRTMSLMDGPALLEKHCTRCHTAQSFDQIEKSIIEWENTLAQMETMGVHLEDAEKVVLLNYLAVADQP